MEAFTCIYNFTTPKVPHHLSRLTIKICEINHRLHLHHLHPTFVLNDERFAKFSNVKENEGKRRIRRKILPHFATLTILVIDKIRAAFSSKFYAFILSFHRPSDGL